MDNEYYLRRIGLKIANILAGITETSWELVEHNELGGDTKKALDLLLMLGIIKQKIFYRSSFKQSQKDSSGKNLGESSIIPIQFVIIDSLFNSERLITCVKKKFHAKFSKRNKCEIHNISGYQLSATEKGFSHLAIIMESLCQKKSDKDYLLLITNWLAVEKIFSNTEDRSSESANYWCERLEYRTDFDSLDLRDGHGDLIDTLWDKGPILSRVFEEENDINQLCDKFNRIMGVSIVGLVQGDNDSDSATDDFSALGNKHSDNNSGKMALQNDEKSDDESNTGRKRDKWIYEQAVEAIPYTDISEKLLTTFPDEKGITPNRCRQVAYIFADDNGLKKPDARKKTKKKRNHPKQD